MTKETLAVRQARLEEQFKAVVTALNTIIEQNKEASEGRRRVYQTQEDMRVDMVGIKHEVDNLKASVEAIKPTSKEYELVRDRVLFAGKLGEWLWKTGQLLLALAAGAMGYYYMFTGKPPP